MDKSLVREAHIYIKNYLDENLSSDHRYHNFDHALSVFKTVLLLSSYEDLNPDDQEILALSALFHDVGIVGGVDGHEERSKDFATEFLLQKKYDAVKLGKIQNCILATNTEVVPSNLLEKIIKDADINNLGNDTYMFSVKALRHEMFALQDKPFSASEWYKKALSFANSHEFYSESAKFLFADKKQSNIALLEKTIKKEKSKNSILPPDKGVLGGKVANMMFKTAIRNHLDLSALADGKANTMLSANALIITITLPLMMNSLRQNVILGIPAVIMVTTCVLSMVYATSATKPIKTHGITKKEDIINGKSDLFFFGNFYNMPFDKYKEGLDYVLSKDKFMDDTTFRNLYFSGKALGGKFNQLRICYTIFITGIILTVLAYAVAYTYSFS